jgi:hypothetical protein
MLQNVVVVGITTTIALNDWFVNRWQPHVANLDILW